MTSNKSSSIHLNDIDPSILRTNNLENQDFSDSDKFQQNSKSKKNDLDLSKILGEFQPQPLVNTNKQIKPNADKEFYYKLKKDLPNQPRRYLFLNSMGEGFNFIQHCEGLCPICSSFKGLFLYSEDEFKNYCLAELQKNGIVTLPEDGDVSMTIIQLLFECTFNDSANSLRNVVFPFCANLLLTDDVPVKYKFPVLLYFLHVILNYENGVETLFDASFLLFAVDFINNFMIAFDEENFKKWKNPSQNINHKNHQPMEEDQESSGVFSNVITIKNRHQNHSQGSIQNEIIWDKKTNNFTYESKKVEFDLDGSMMIEKDAITDYGKYTKYFWKLHVLHHCLKVILEMIRKAPKTHTKLVETQLANLIEQIREIVIIFFKYTEKYIPTLPFHVDTECWTETKEIIFETLVYLFC